MLYFGMFGVWLAGASTQKYLDHNEGKFLLIAAVEGISGILIVLASLNA